MDFGDSIGISDILGWRECPRRMSYGMRRHTGQGQQSDELTPESVNYGARYGSAIHEVLAAVEQGYDDEAAIARAWRIYGPYLSPGDIDLLRTDLAVYHRRDMPNVRTVVSEEDLRVPLLVHNGKRIFFRFKLDRLYQRLDAPGTFIHHDYKSSKWARSQEEVDEDEQMWAYNWGIHEYFPECERLIQYYDQLRYGQLPTRKTAGQRRQMGDWLRLNVIAIMDDNDVRPDDLLRPRHNQWCPWCPVMESCEVIERLSDYALTRVATLAPEHKVGRRRELELQAERLPEYVGQFRDANLATKVLKRYDESVKDLMRNLTDGELAQLGYGRSERGSTSFPPDVLEQMAEKLGPAFWEAASVTKTKLQSALNDQPELLEWSLAQGVSQSGTPVLRRLREDEIPEVPED